MWLVARKPLITFKVLPCCVVFHHCSYPQRSYQRTSYNYFSTNILLLAHSNHIFILGRSIEHSDPRSRMEQGWHELGAFTLITNAHAHEHNSSWLGLCGIQSKHGQVRSSPPHLLRHYSHHIHNYSHHHHHHRFHKANTPLPSPSESHILLLILVNILIHNPIAFIKISRYLLLLILISASL